MTSTKQIFSPPQIGYPSMDERERREINNTTMGYEEVRDTKTQERVRIASVRVVTVIMADLAGAQAPWSGPGGKSVIMRLSPQEPMLMP